MKGGCPVESFYILKVLLDPVIVIVPILAGLFFALVAYRQFQKQRVEILIKPGLCQSRWITVGGTESDFYYDIDKASFSPKTKEKVDNWYIENLKELQGKFNIDGIAFIEREAGPVGAITKKDLITAMTGIPSIIVRPRKRIRASVVKGIEKVEGQRIVVITDVVTTGASVNRVIDILQDRGVTIVAVIAMVNRGGSRLKRAFEQRSIEFRYADDLGWLKNQSAL